PRPERRPDAALSPTASREWICHVQDASDDLRDMDLSDAFDRLEAFRDVQLAEKGEYTPEAVACLLEAAGVGEAEQTMSAARDPRLNIDVDYHNVVDAQFFQQIFDRQLSCMRGDGWITSAGAGAAPGRILARADYSRAGRLELLIEVEGAVVQLVFVDLSLH